MSALPPILPETLIDVVHAVGGLDSAVEGQRILGAAARVQFFEELPKAHAEDPVASRYLTEVLAATASALRAFSAVRTPYKAMREREQSIDALRRGLLSPSYLLTPADKSSTRSWPMWLLRSTPLVLAAGSPIWAEFLGLSGQGWSRSSASPSCSPCALWPGSPSLMCSSPDGSPDSKRGHIADWGTTTTRSGRRGRQHFRGTSPRLSTS